MIGGLLLVACGGANVEEERSAATAVAAPTPVDIDTIPNVDLSQHSVPLDEIYFDTFRPTNRAVPLSEADETLIRSLRDAIPPIYQPVFETAAAAE